MIPAVSPRARQGLLPADGCWEVTDSQASPDAAPSGLADLPAVYSSLSKSEPTTLGGVCNVVMFVGVRSRFKNYFWPLSLTVNTELTVFPLSSSNLLILDP